MSEKVTSKTKLKTKRKIIDVSKELFEEKGISNTKISEIAKQASITRRTVYDHFPSKAKIINEVMYEYLVDLYSFDIGYLDTDSGFIRISKLFHKVFDTYFEKKHIMRFLISYYQEYPFQTDDEAEIIEKVGRYIKLNQFKEIQDLGVEDGSITCENTNEVAMTILQHVIGISMRYSLRSDMFIGNDIFVPKEKLHKSIDLLLKLFKT